MEGVLREFSNTDWITIVLFTTFGMLALAKITKRAKFDNLLQIATSNKYFANEISVTKNTAIFNLLLFGVHVLSISLFISYYLNNTARFAQSSKPILFFQIVAIYTTILIGKYLVEKIIGVAFGIEPLVDMYLHFKTTNRNYISLLLLPPLVFMTYCIAHSKFILYFVLLILYGFYLFLLFLNYRSHHKIILNNLFYFILYLCALEIGPYIILYKVIMV